MMNPDQLRGLRLAALLFLTPGLGGLLLAACVATQRLENLPRMPIPAEMRMTPRNIHGIVVYETEEEHKQLSLLEYGSFGVFGFGLVLGVVYMRRWGVAYAISAEEDPYAEDSP
jgi:hypothetical protein